MGSLDLLNMCVAAFSAVFLLLALLALVMRLIIVAFPHKTTGTDAAVFAAVATALSTVYPGTRITKIEEIK